MTEDSGWSRAAGYVRVSTEHQKEDGSHERQRKMLEEWSERNDVAMDVFEDIAISGQNPEREQYQELMDNLDKYDVVVVRELSRFGRYTQTVLEDLDIITDKHGMDFVSIRENIDTGSAMGRAMVTMIAAFNQMVADLASERSEETARRYKEQGKGWGRPEKLDEQQIRKMLDLRSRNVSYSALARIFRAETDDGKLSRSTVKRYCDKYTLAEDGKTVQLQEEEDDEM